MRIHDIAASLRLDEFLLPLISAQAPYEWGWRMHPMWGWGFGMMLMMMLFFGVMLLVGIFGMRWFVGPGRPGREDSALTILRERFARGEIDKDEFEARRKELS